MSCGINPGWVKEALGKHSHFTPCGFCGGFTETAGRTPRKRKLCPAWWVPWRNVLLPDRNFIPLAFHSLQGTHCAGKDSPCLLAAVSPGTVFSSGSDCWIAGKLVSVLETQLLSEPPLQGGHLVQVPGVKVGKGGCRGTPAPCGAFLAMAAGSGEQSALPAPS